MKLDVGKKKGFVISGTPSELRKLSFLPGVTYRRKEGVLRMTESIASWRALRDLQFDSVVTPARDKLNQLRADHRNHRKEVRRAARRFKRTGETDIPVPLKTIPYSHQVRAYGFASSIDHSALFMDQGTGKTLVALSVCGRRYEDQQTLRVLVICPKAVKPVWPRELRKHADFDHTCSVDKPPEGPGLQFWVTNYDRVKRELRRLRKWKPDLVILDESHKIKNRKAARSKAVMALGAQVKYKLILSGTPFGKCISEVWSQFKFLNKDIFGSNYSLFKERYLVMGGYMGYSVEGYKNEDEFADKMHSIAFRVKKEECLDLPPVSYQKLYIDPDPKTKKIYKQFEAKLYAEIDNFEISVSGEAQKQMKLRQMSGGSVKTDTQEMAHISNQKMTTLKDFMEDRVKEKTLIFFSFTHEIKMASQMLDSLGIKYLTLQGATPDSDREVFEDRFQEDESVGAALIQIATGAEGMTLTAADVAIFFSPSFSYIGYSQAKDRFNRIGQLRPMTILFIIMNGTVDERVVDVLECNGQLTDTYLEQKRDYRIRENIMAKQEGYKASDLAAELEISAADLRKHLRALKIEKPEAGWVWPKKTDDDLKEIRTSLKARIKELASKPAKTKAEVTPAKKSRKTKAVEETAEETAPVDAPKPKRSRAKKPVAAE